ncbi:hypothetical protein MIR68_009475 [Amoeboaphelidium protococcarum]|nr:hypothetical protein MIR68_009475 [Amoeboaphelidium protococcarum]
MECLSRMSAEDGPKILCELAALTKAKRVKLTKTRGAKHEISLLHGNLLVLLKDVLVQDKARYKPKAFTKSRVAHDDTPKVPQSEDAKPVACDVTQSATVLNDNPSIVQVSKLKQMAETYLLADDEEFIVMMDRLNNPSIAQFVQELIKCQYQQDIVFYPQR